jgi:hypothetical protein
MFVAGIDDLRHTDADEKKYWDRVCGCGLNSAGLAKGEVPSSCELSGKFRLPDRRMSSCEKISTLGFYCLYLRIHAKVEEASNECGC